MKFSKLAKKGNVGAGWAGVATGFAIALVSLAIIAVVISALKGTQTAGTVAYNVLNNTETFMLNATSQLGTAGTVLGIMALVAIVAVFGFLGYQKYKER